MGLDPKLRAMAALALGALFLGALWLSPLQSLLGFAPEPLRSENRRLAERPPFDARWPALAQFPGKFETYFNDRFGFRKTLVRFHHLAKLKLFRISPVAKVVVGKAGWLFAGEREALDALRPLPPFTAAELARWAAGLERWRNLLAARGARFLFLVVPLKGTVYPEYLPGAVRRVRPATRLAQLYDHLRARTDLEIVDLRPVLERAKRGHRLYHRTDTHWNDLGAHAAYLAIVRRLARWYPHLRPRPLADFELNFRAVDGGNLARMLAMGDLLGERKWSLAPREPWLAREVPLFDAAGRKIRTRLAMERPADGLPRAVVVHDSFMEAIKPMLSEHFSRVLYLRGKRLPPGLMQKEAPDVVILQMGEGALRRNPFRGRPF